MRITFVMPFLSLEGGSRVVATYAQGLVGRGHHVTVVSCGSRPWPLSRRLKFRIKRALRGELGPDRPPTHFEQLRDIHRTIAGPGPIRPRHVPAADVIVATWWETAEWVAAMPASKGRKLHLIQHDERVFTSDAATRQRVEATWRLPGFARIAVAGWLRELGRREFGVDCTLINNAVDTELFDAPLRQRSASFAVALMYQRRPFKGTDVSLKAVELARRQVPALRLRAFGPHEEVAELPLPADASLAVAPPQPEIAALYRSCDAYLFGSRCEGFGLPILEAMACRTPVIGTPTGAAPELLAGGGGRLVRMEDPQSMADAIAELATMPPEQWLRMSEIAYATAREHTWARAVEQFETVLAGLIPGAGLAGSPVPAPPALSPQRGQVGG